MSLPKAARNQAVAEHFETSACYAVTAREFGLTRERVRQLVSRVGDGAPADGRRRYSEDTQRALADLAVREGVYATARLAGVSVVNLRAWVGRWLGPSGRPSGRPGLEAEARRDFRIRLALETILPQRGGA